MVVIIKQKGRETHILCVDEADGLHKVGQTLINRSKRLSQEVKPKITISFHD